MNKNGVTKFDAVKSAKARLKGYAHSTPILTSTTLNRRLRADIHFKCENFQKAGAFKFRGAFNAMSQLSKEQRSRGVVTYSSGNHAQAVAMVGRMLNIPTTIVMPDNAPATKRAATEAYGATVVAYSPEKDSRKDIAESLQSQHGYTMIPPFDHPDIIAGQGTAAMEMFETLPHLDMLLVPCGGGGLLSGSAIAAKTMNPSCRVIGIEPEVADDATRSFYSRQLQSVKNPPTIADGTRTSCLGDLTFPLILEHVDDMKTVSEGAIMDAVKFLFFRMKLVVEPSGALGLAALLSLSGLPKGRIGVLLSGGNIDAATMKTILDA
jgi:threonine dehydratase